MAPAFLTAAFEALLALSSTETKTIWEIQEWHHIKTITHTLSNPCTSALPSSTASNPSPLTNPTSHWPGWSGIQHLIAFGDSYTTTGFNTSLHPPSPSNPLGNPPYPGSTATNGPNYLDFLTTTHNTTLLLTLNLAAGGATLSPLIPPYPTSLSLSSQIHALYLPLYTPPPPAFPWHSSNTLFVSFIGINDITVAYSAPNASEIFHHEFAVYASLLDTLYHSGARYFLLLNVPPVNLSPGTLAKGPEAVAAEGLAIAAWNANLTALATNLTQTYADAEVFVFDTNAAFTQVLDDPESFGETAVVKNTTDFCPGYAEGTPSWYTLYDDCAIPVDEYFWLNGLHPGFRVMNVTAREIVRLLEGGSWAC